ncbi:IclR family transcriptional regulator [Kordiimonas gwangyangensis]|uniref:IclR family transcriptional regulator n=1 Tax=Kordiimonas gwangyangensis TaxID=288022 RepID=UPI000368ABC3|nr:IclR family transcriptional regulator [Kordiimonas gwangyangensis]
MTSTAKAVALFSHIVSNPGTTVETAAKELALPVSTAYRLLVPFFRAGLLARPKNGEVMPGIPLMLSLSQADIAGILGALARPHLARLSKTLKMTSHLGIFENDMVTYLVKVPHGEEQVFTREGMQLEAYCSAIGKVLLSELSTDNLAAYLAGGPFIRLTPHTVTDPHHMHSHLMDVSRQGYATDIEEISLGLHCMAMPVFGPARRALAAISVSCGDKAKLLAPSTREQLKQTAAQISGACQPGL